MARGVMKSKIQKKDQDGGRQVLLKLVTDFEIAENEIFINQHIAHKKKAPGCVGGHQYVVEYIGVCSQRLRFNSDLFRGYSGHGVVLVFEFCEGQSLHGYSRRPGVRLECVTTAALQLAEAFAFLHSIDIVHNDLHDENIIVVVCQGTGYISSIKLIDFGWATTKTRGFHGSGCLLNAAPEISEMDKCLRGVS